MLRSRPGTLGGAAAQRLQGWQEPGSSAEKVLGATFKRALEEMAFLEKVCERLDLEPDQTDVEECREALAAHWRRLLEKGAE